MKKTINKLLIFSVSISLSVLINVKSFARPPAGMVIIPASDFLDEIPKANIITDAGSLRTSWVFNNTGIVLNSLTNLIAEVTIAEDGAYHLFVRSQGERANGFKVAVYDKVILLSDKTLN